MYSPYISVVVLASIHHAFTAVSSWALLVNDVGQETEPGLFASM